MTINQVPLGTGPPTLDELRVYYTPKFTWWQLKLFVNAGDLGLLKRDKLLQARYSEWTKQIRAEYGSVVDYLLKHRLQWGRPDSLALLPSELDCKENATDSSQSDDPIPEYFTTDTPPAYISIIQNDWPYSVPLNVEHSLIWTKVPILPSPSLIMPSISVSLSSEQQEKLSVRLAQDGIWGFTGSVEAPPSPSLLAENLGALSEWGIILDKLVVSSKGSPQEEEVVKLSGMQVQKFVTRRWVEREWETCWFVNPPRLQSVKGLAHIHVFARKKSAEEMDLWDSLDRN